MADVTGISLASVVPALTGVTTVHGRAPRRAAAGRRGRATCRCRSACERPTEVGADRLVNGLAVARLYGTPAIVIDFGTATKFDCVARDGAFVGGAIAPGARAGPRGAGVPHGSPAPDRARGAAEGDRHRHGLGHAVRRRPGLPGPHPGPAGDDPNRAGQDREGRRLETIQVVLTGGLSAAPWARALPGVDAIDPELTLKGLAILWALASGEPTEPGGTTVGWAGSAAGSIHVISEPTK